jgi:hypothetical protein
MNRAIATVTTMSKRKTPFEKRLGRCYELSAKAVLDHPEWTLVHGRLTAPARVGEVKYPLLDHAWCEYEHDLPPVDEFEGIKIEVVFDPVMGRTYPKAIYYSMYKVEVAGRYSFDEMAKKLVTFKHFGPWPA